MVKQTTPHQPYILALDVGTLSIRALVYDQSGRVQAAVSRPIALHQKTDVVIEQAPSEIIDTLFEVMHEVLAHPQVAGRPIQAAGLSTQRSSIVAWERATGRALSPIISWQDRRAAAYLAPLAKHAAQIKETSGLFLSPHYGASKLRWCINHYPELQNGHLNGSRPPYLFGPLASFILFHLLEGQPHIVDHVNASRTQLLDLHQRNWSPDLLAHFGLKIDPLPACCPTQHNYGTIKGTTIELQAVNGDQNAAIHGLGPLDEGTFIVNVGTGAFVLLSTGSSPIHHPRLLTSIANSTSTQATYLLEGTVNGAGATIKWASEAWGEPELIHKVQRWLEEVNDPPLFLNTIGGLGSPLWQTGPPPEFFPAEGSTAQKAVAIIESIIFLIKINLEAMINTGQDARRIRISGGLSEIDGLCQKLADLSQRLVIRSEERQSTSRGIAWLAGQPSENWDNLDDVYFLPRPNKPLQTRYRTFCSKIGWI